MSPRPSPKPSASTEAPTRPIITILVLDKPIFLLSEILSRVYAPNTSLFIEDIFRHFKNLLIVGK